MERDDTQATGDFPIGPTVLHYRILEKLGEGGMGVVYKAKDTRLDRLVALKFLPPSMRHNEELKRRLADEARAASALDHPNIVVIHDIDETPEGDLFIAMAFHDGATLRERIEGGITPADALRIARQVASGLARAHEHGIFHRDIKPANIIVAKDGVARIIDFGLAKSSDVTATIDGGTRGTPLYMSPEQASGKVVDYRTDLWSLGAVLYEMLTGTPPYRGDSQLAVMRAIVDGEPPRLRDGVAGAIVERAMQKDPALRYQSAAEMERDLAAALAKLESPVAPRRRSRKTFALAAAITLLAAVAGWFYRSSERRHWAREQAIPEISRLRGEDRPLAAYLLTRQAAQYLPGDTQLAKTTDGLTRTITLRSTPPGALVEIKDYLSPGDAWFSLGTTPLENVTIPVGYLRWRVSKAGAGELLWAPAMENVHGYVNQLDFPLDLVAQTPQGSIPVPAAPQFDAYNFWFGYMGPWDLPLFYVDRFEVTNREYQEFVDKGGYQKREYWKEKFLRDGKELSWEEAMALLRDGSGRPGPATWEAGHFPAGQAEYPVVGVSWYEAMAYAEFAGKSLPAVAQWYRFAAPDVSRYITTFSNFTALAPVGKYAGIGQFGTYDTAGNAAEWLRNGPGGVARYSAGGAAEGQSGDFGAPPYAIQAFERTARNGFRCVKNAVPLPASALAPIGTLSMDASQMKPVGDETFEIYRSMYAYDSKPLHESRQPMKSDSPDWREEAITIDAAYNGERLPLYLFLPARVRAPYQTVVFFPGGSVVDSRSSKTLNDMRFIDYIIKGGRAVLYPIYKGTYERPVPMDDLEPVNAAGKDVFVQQCKDFSRAMEYLQTRTEIDSGKIAFLGFSLGAAYGVNIAALNPKLRAVVLLEAGIAAEKLFAGTNSIDFAPRVKQPVLMVNGTFDMAWVGYKELFDLLGTPAANKKLLEFQTGHAVSDHREDMIRAVTSWLDQYLGPVN